MYKTYNTESNIFLQATVDLQSGMIKQFGVVWLVSGIMWVCVSLECVFVD